MQAWRPFALSVLLIAPPVAVGIATPATRNVNSVSFSRIRLSAGVCCPHLARLPRIFRLQAVSTLLSGLRSIIRFRLAGVSLTLLFTDIEGSTRLVQQLGVAYLAALEEHRRTVRDALAATGGVEVDCRGDEFMATFEQPDAAVAAALAIQEAEKGVVRVRVGIHTGEPLRVEGGYVGVDVHRAARICAAGHGGQVLLSETTCGGLGAGVTVRDLGVHQLRGL